ncbi:hypothetical protein BpHYR1_025588 [Brachionus plicatilis]|uniref:Uncharacterized protein n=1 Tax=Brachionus plicatilis TaxID=10195 RepID=A0A3M7S584_BRAPC|nr:hypothetical protein BpHYR1_025588 [Brachionus plicatilis]
MLVFWRQKIIKPVLILHWPVDDIDYLGIKERLHLKILKFDTFLTFFLLLKFHQIEPYIVANNCAQIKLRCKKKSLHAFFYASSFREKAICEKLYLIPVILIQKLIIILYSKLFLSKINTGRIIKISKQNHISENLPRTVGKTNRTTKPTQCKNQLKKFSGDVQNNDTFLETKKYRK